MRELETRISGSVIGERTDPRNFGFERGMDFCVVTVFAAGVQVAQGQNYIVYKLLIQLGHPWIRGHCGS